MWLHIGMVIEMPKLTPDEYALGTALLKAVDLPKYANKATIEDVHYVQLSVTGNSLMVKFKEFEKELPLNKTNVNALVKLLGDVTEDWIGKVVMLLKVPTKNPQSGAQVEGVRIGRVEE